MSIYSLYNQEALFAEIFHIAAVWIILHQIFYNKNAQGSYVAIAMSFVAFHLAEMLTLARTDTAIGISLKTWLMQIVVFVLQLLQVAWIETMPRENPGMYRQYHYYYSQRGLVAVIRHFIFFFAASACLIAFAVKYFDPVKTTYQSDQEPTKSVIWYCGVSCFFSVLVIVMGVCSSRLECEFLYVRVLAILTSSLEAVSLIPQAFMHRHHRRHMRVSIFIGLFGCYRLCTIYGSDANFSEVFVSLVQAGIAVYAFLPSSANPLTAETSVWLHRSRNGIAVAFAMMAGVTIHFLVTSNFLRPYVGGSVEKKNYPDGDTNGDNATGLAAVLCLLSPWLCVVALGKYYFLPFLDTHNKTRVELYANGFVFKQTFYAFEGSQQNADALYYLARRQPPPGMLAPNESMRLLTYGSQCYQGSVTVLNERCRECPIAGSTHVGNEGADCRIVEPGVGELEEPSCSNMLDIDLHTSAQTTATSRTDLDNSEKRASGEMTECSEASGVSRSLLSTGHEEFADPLASTASTGVAETTKSTPPRKEPTLTRIERTLLCIAWSCATFAIWQSLSIRCGKPSCWGWRGRVLSTRCIEHRSCSVWEFWDDSTLIIMVASWILSLLFIFDFQCLQTPPTTSDEAIVDNKTMAKRFIFGLISCSCFVLAPSLFYVCLDAMPFLYAGYFCGTTRSTFDMTGTMQQFTTWLDPPSVAVDNDEKSTQPHESRGMFADFVCQLRLKFATESLWADTATADLAKPLLSMSSIEDGYRDEQSRPEKIDEPAESVNDRDEQASFDKQPRVYSGITIV